MVGSANKQDKLIIGRNVYNGKLLVEATFNPKTPCGIELLDHLLHVFVDDPWAPSIGGGTARLQNRGRSGRHFPGDLGSSNSVLTTSAAISVCV